MDYDRTAMPAAYDAARSYSPEVLRLWLERLSAHLPKASIRDIIDLGCGTGRYSRALAAHFEAKLIGIDPSAKMLEQARAKQAEAPVSFRQGSGEALPADDASADLVFMSMVFHHLREPARTAEECRRVLRPGGHLCLRNGTREGIDSYPYLEFFPGLRAIVEKRLTSRRRIVAIFESAGFEITAHEAVGHPEGRVG